MKNKILKLIILSVILEIGVFTVVKAASKWTDALQGYTFSALGCSEGSNTLCFAITPSPMYSKNYDNVVQGIRITVVDENGNRKSNSADFIRNSVILNGNTILGQTTLKIDNSGLDSIAVLGKYTRNEIFYNAYDIRDDVPVVYYWPSIPNVTMENNQEIRPFFINLYNNDSQTFMQLLNILNYGGYVNGGAQITSYNQINKMHYLLVEPLVYIQLHTYAKRPAKFAGYGTATEVYKMLTMEGLNPPDEVFDRNAMPKAVYVGDSIDRNGHYQTVTAGLASIEHINQSSGWGKYYFNVTNNGIPYGVSSGHFWLNDTECDEECGCGTVCDDDKKNYYSCEFDGLKVDLNANCSVATSGSIKDTNNWACIYRQPRSNSVNTYAGQFYQHDNNLDDNPFCNIACREEITYYYPSDGAIDLYAGHRFTVGSSELYTNNYQNTDNLKVLGPIRVVAVKTCSTAIPPTISDATISKTQDSSTIMSYAKIDVEGFKTAYAAADAAVKKAWDDYQIELLNKTVANKANNKEVTPSGSTSGVCSSTQGAKQYRRVTYCNGNYHSESIDTYSPGHPDYNKGGYFERESSMGNGCKDTYTLIGDASTSTSHTITTYKASASYVDRNGVRHSIEKVAKISSCGSHSTLATYDQDKINAAKTAYDNAVKARDNLLTKLKQCNNYYGTYEELVPDISFTYLDTVKSKYSTNVTLEANLTSLTVTSKYNNSGTPTNRSNYSTDSDTIYGSSASISRAVCNTEGKKCTTEQIAYPSNTKVETTTTVQYDYTLPSGLYRYVDKYGVSYSQEYVAASGTEWAKEYKDIGYPNFPIAFDTLSGSYDYQINLGQNKFGVNQKFTRFSSEFASVGKPIPNTLDYTCQINVKNCILQYCPPDTTKLCEDGCCDKTCGIQVIYRPISLTDPFPYIDGEGRSPGSNWSGPNVVYDYITTNRNVREYEVYHLKPMYQFVLNSANIRTIRKYNNTQAADYNDFNLECIDGKYCKSEFLRDGIASGYFKFTNANSDGGVCFNATKDNWESCRVTNGE